MGNYNKAAIKQQTADMDAARQDTARRVLGTAADTLDSAVDTRNAIERKVAGDIGGTAYGLTAPDTDVAFRRGRDAAEQVAGAPDSVDNVRGVVDAARAKADAQAATTQAMKDKARAAMADPGQAVIDANDDRAGDVDRLTKEYFDPATEPARRSAIRFILQRYGVEIPADTDESGHHEIPPGARAADAEEYRRGYLSGDSSPEIGGWSFDARRIPNDQVRDRANRGIYGDPRENSVREGANAELDERLARAGKQTPTKD